MDNAAAETEIEVELTFDGFAEGVEHISNEENRTKLKKVIADGDEMKVRRTSASPKERQLWNPSSQKWAKAPTGADAAFNNCIPRFEFVHATQHLKDVSAYSSKSPIGQMLGGVISEILSEDQAYREFREKFEALFQAESSGIQQKLKELGGRVKKHLQQQFPDCVELDFRVEEPEFEDLLKNFATHIDDGVKTTAEEKGDGMQRALMLAIIKTYADHRREEALGRAFIFFIDEAELHLHPTAQRQLKTALLELSAGTDQVFLTTHSSVFLADEHTAQAVFAVSKEVGHTTVTPVRESSKQGVIYDLLGGNPADLFLPSNFLIVEGQSEEILLRGLIERFYPNEPQIQIVVAEGDDERERQNMEAINLVFKPLTYRPIYRDKLGILLDKPDGDKAVRFEEFKTNNPSLGANGQLFCLPVGGLEEYYPALWRPAAKIKGPAKKKLAEKVATEIEKNDFESKMTAVFQALSHCWKNAYRT